MYVCLPAVAVMWASEHDIIRLMCVCAFPGIAVSIRKQNYQSHVHVPFSALQWSVPLSEHDVISLVRMCAFVTVVCASVWTWHYQTHVRVCLSSVTVVHASIRTWCYQPRVHVCFCRCCSDHVQYGWQSQEVWWTGGPAVRVHGRLLQLGPQQTQRQVRGRVGCCITALCSTHTCTLVYVHWDSLRGAMIMCFRFFVCLLFVDAYKHMFAFIIISLDHCFQTAYPYFNLFGYTVLFGTLKLSETQLERQTCEDGHYLLHMVWLWAYLWLNSESGFLLQWFLSDTGFGKLTVKEKAFATKNGNKHW